MAITKIVTPPGEKSEIKFLNVPFSVAQASDTDHALFVSYEKAIWIVDAVVVFQQVNLTSAEVDIDLESGIGVAGSAIASYDTVNPVALGTAYSFVFSASRKIAAGTWLQVRVDNDDADLACWGQVVIQYVELND